VGQLRDHPQRGGLAQRPSRHGAEPAGDLADQAGEAAPQIVGGPALGPQHTDRQQGPPVPEQTAVGELPVGIRGHAVAAVDGRGGHAGQQELDAARRMLGTGRWEQGGGRRQLVQVFGQQAGRVAELQDRGHALPVDDHRGRVAGQVDLLDAGAGGDKPEQVTPRAGDMPAAGEHHRGAEPLERPAAAQAQPGQGEQDDGEEGRRGEHDRAVHHAGHQHDRGDLSGHELAGANAERPAWTGWSPPGPEGSPGRSGQLRIVAIEARAGHAGRHRRTPVSPR
jgi:hypothetical protein